MHESEYVVERFANHRVTRVRQLAHLGRGVRQRGVAVEEDHVGTRAHDLGDNGLRGVEHVVENRAFVFGKIRVRAHQHAQLLVRDLGLRLVRVEAE